MRIRKGALCLSFSTLLVVVVTPTVLAGPPRYAHQYATSGTGTDSDPYLGWGSAIAADTEVIFQKGFFESPVTATSLPGGTVLTGVDGTIVRWPANRSSVNPIFQIAASTNSVVIRGLHFEPGVTVPADGVSSQGGGAYVNIGTDGSSSVVTNVTIEGCRFGIARYSTVGGGGTAYQIEVTSSVESLVIRNNRMDAATHNVYLHQGSGTQQYTYKGLVFQNNSVAFSQSRAFFGSVVSIGDVYAPPPNYPATFEHVMIVGNAIRGNNGTFDIMIAGTNLLVADNSVFSDNVDGFSFQVGVFPRTSVVYANNNCYAEPSGENGKMLDPNCDLKLVSTTNGTVVGNVLRGKSLANRVETVYSTNVLVSANTVDVARTSVSSSDTCYSIGRSSFVTFDSNSCHNTGDRVFNVWGSTGEVHDLTLTNNQLYTTAGSAIASYFFDFSTASASNVTVRGNRVWGQNLTGSFLTGSVTALNKHGNQETVGETGWRIGSDQVDDITGTGLMVSAGALSINSTVATLSGSQTLTNKMIDTAGGNTVKVNGNTLSASAGSATITVPSVTDTLVGRGTTDTLTNKTVDVEAAGNTIRTMETVFLPAGTCKGGTANSSAWNTTLANGATFQCSGSNVYKAQMNFADGTAVNNAYTVTRLPSDWTGNIDMELQWFANASDSSVAVVWQVATACVGDGEGVDPAWNTAQLVTDYAKAVANQANTATITNLTTTGCAAGELLYLKLFREALHEEDTLAVAASVLGGAVKLRRAQ